MTLSDSQKRVLKGIAKQVIKAYQSQKDAAVRWGESNPSIYDVRVVGLTPKKAQIFVRLGLLTHRGTDPDYSGTKTYNYGRDVRYTKEQGEARLYFTRLGLETARDLLEGKSNNKRNTAVPYIVEIHKNGALRGTLGPYAQKADADNDARAMRSRLKGVRVSVSPVQGARSNGAAAAEKGLQTRIKTFLRKVDAVRTETDAVKAVRYYDDSVEGYAYDNGLPLPSGLRQRAYDALTVARQQSDRERAAETERLKRELRESRRPYDWMYQRNG